MNNELTKNLKDMTPDDFYQIINSNGNNEIKDWLAKLGSERIDELFDPSLIVERSINTWRAMGYSEKWIKNKLSEIINNSNKK
ncbi:MAG TPA: hypothetical protein IAC20_01570 [Candidatus Faecisoma merdavium]|nr:hypothetical protein [Candidatus Faecisoma merdavium]